MLFLREAMSYHGVLRLVLLTLCSILVPAVLAGDRNGIVAFDVGPLEICHSQTVAVWLTLIGTLREAVPSVRRRQGGIQALQAGTGQDVLVPSLFLGYREPAEYPQDSVPTLWNEPPELPSGTGPFDAATTTARLSDATAFPPYTSELEPEDTTHLHRLDTGDGSLGPGAIGAIVIASLLGTSVLVALVVITLRKFSVS